MTQIKIPEAPLVKPKIKIDRKTVRKLLNNVQEESQVIIHCAYTGSTWDNRIRIWKSTFLYAKESTHKSKLVHAENITMYPKWMKVGIGSTITFTLIFTGLPKDCKKFDFIENIPEEGGFVFPNITRNKTDVYFIDLT